MKLAMFSAFRRRRRLLLEENGEDASPRAGGKRLTSLQLCMQLTLACACIAILVFGLSMTAVGLWSYKSQESYLTITENDAELTRLPFTMMVTGVFVAILGAMGILGSLFFRTITGQILLGVFSFILVLVIISEVGAGAAAIKLKANVEEVFIRTAEASLLQYSSDDNVADRWNAFQRDNGCCGARGYVNNKPPYYEVFQNFSVPTSCCKNLFESQDDCDEFAQNATDCDEFAQNATEFREHIYDKGCVFVAIDQFNEVVTLIAIVAITIIAVQLLAVCLAVAVVYMSSKLDPEKSSYSYKKLLQEELNQNDSNQQTST